MSADQQFSETAPLLLATDCSCYWLPGKSFKQTFKTGWPSRTRLGRNALAIFVLLCGFSSSKRNGDVGDDVHISEDLNIVRRGEGLAVFHQLYRTDSSLLVPPLPAQCHHRDAHIPQYVTLMQHIIPLVNRTTALPPHHKRNQQKGLHKAKNIYWRGKWGDRTTHLKTNPKYFPLLRRTVLKWPADPHRAQRR